MAGRLDLTGLQFGRLLVKAKSGDKDKFGAVFWYCVCDCGSETCVRAANLRSGGTISCGCAQMDATKTHGMTKTKVFKSWESMKQRCLNPNAPDYSGYGAKGIKICPEWVNSFENFYRDMGDRPELHSLDRINVYGNYEKENCRWATRSMQQRNKTTSFLIEWDGKILCAADWADIVNISSKIICGRINAGWLPEDALTKPNRKVKK